MSAWILMALLGPGTAAAGAAWFAEGGQTDLAETVDVPLYRGEVGDHLPLVAVQIGDSDDLHLAVVDLGGSWTRIGRALVDRLALKTDEVKVGERTLQRVVLPEVRVGDLRLSEVHAEVVGGDTLVLGAWTVAVAVLPSAGTVRFAPAAAGAELVRAVGAPVPTDPAGTASWMEHGEKRWANGISWRVPATVDGREGRVHVHTDWTATQVPSGGGALQVDLGGLSLGTRAAVDASLADPADDFLGAVGYDVLYAMDLAFSPADQTVSLAAAAELHWQDPAPIYRTAAESRHAAWVDSLEAPPPDALAEAKPKIGFAAAETPVEVVTGEAGDPAAIAAHLALGRALWQTGAPDAAIARFLDASLASGDQCEAYDVLGQHRLRNAGSLLEQDFVAKLVRDPLARAGGLWEAWSALPRETRQRVREGRPVPEQTFQIRQDARCAASWAHYASVRLALGDHHGVQEIWQAHPERDSTLPFVAGLAAYREGDAPAAEALLREAIHQGGRDLPAVRIALANALIAQGRVGPAGAWLARETPVHNPLIAALATWDARARGHLAQVDATSEPVAAALVRAIHGDRDGLASLDDALSTAEGRWAGSPVVACQRAVWLALSGEDEAARTLLKEVRPAAHRVADYWVARALTASDGEGFASALAELRLRFPVLPLELGLSEPGK